MISSLYCCCRSKRKATKDNKDNSNKDNSNKDIINNEEEEYVNNNQKDQISTNKSKAAVNDKTQQQEIELKRKSKKQNKRECEDDQTFNGSFSDADAKMVESAIVAASLSADAEEEKEVLLTRYAAELKRLKEDSLFFEEHRRSPHPIPSFRFDELEIGPMLGIGGFCTVKEIRGITLIEQDHQDHHQHQQDHDNINNNYLETDEIKCVDVNCDSDADIISNNNDNDNDIHDDDNRSNTTSGIDIQFANSSTRTYMSQNTLRDSNARYAIKQLRNDLIHQDDFYDDKGNRKRSRKAIHWRGMLDLAIEAEFLSVLSHPNIVKMRGVASCPQLMPTCPRNIKYHAHTNTNDSNGGGFFLVLDRLFGTLHEVIGDRWRKEEKAVESSGSFFGELMSRVTKVKNGSAVQMKKQMRKEMYLERMTVAYDVASAFRFLHTKRLVYRDIKSANIGFDVRGDIKVFDFGLCKELPNQSIPTTPNTRKTGPLYKLTARTGSRPYMAPEILFGKPYNQKADVFSFGILLYEIFALKLPFEGFTNLDYKTKVFSNANYRPKLGKKWPTVMKALLEECWDGSMENRPEFERIASVLKAEMADMVDDLNSNRSGSVKNRTAHLLNRSAASRHNRMMSAAAVAATAPSRGEGTDLDYSQRSSHYRLAFDDVEEDEE